MKKAVIISRLPAVRAGGWQEEQMRRWKMKPKHGKGRARGKAHSRRCTAVTCEWSRNAVAGNEREHSERDSRQGNDREVQKT